MCRTVGHRNKECAEIKRVLFWKPFQLEQGFVRADAKSSDSNHQTMPETRMQKRRKVEHADRLRKSNLAKAALTIVADYWVQGAWITQSIILRMGNQLREDRKFIIKEKEALLKLRNEFHELNERGIRVGIAPTPPDRISELTMDYNKFSRNLLHTEKLFNVMKDEKILNDKIVEAITN